MILKFKQNNQAQLLAIAESYMNTLMQASTDKDYQQHIQHFSKRLKILLDEQRFHAVVEQYQQEKGFFKARTFVASFVRPYSFAVVWRQTFTQVQGDYVAEMVLIEEDGKLVVDHVMVF